MRFYYLFTLLAIYMSSYSQTPTQIDSLGYKFKIDIPEGSEYQFLESSTKEEAKDPVYETYLQIVLKLDEHFIYVNALKTSDFDKERAKTGWLTDSQTKISAETNHSLVICTKDNAFEESHILYHKVLPASEYTFNVFFQSLTLSEVERLIQIFDNVCE